MELKSGMFASLAVGVRPVERNPKLATRYQHYR